MKRYKLKDTPREILTFAGSAFLVWTFFRLIFSAEINHWSVGLVLLLSSCFFLLDLFKFFNEEANYVLKTTAYNQRVAQAKRGERIE